MYLLRSRFSLIFCAWLVLVTGGLGALAWHNDQPGEMSDGPSCWPARSKISQSKTVPTLVMFAHPHCPCTRASLTELAELMSRCVGRLSAVVVFVKPEHAPLNWEKTAAWHKAQAIPGVKVVVDAGGLECQRFKSLTSGEVLLYDVRGAQIFHGGITASRGHEGDNLGSSAIQSLVLEGKPSHRSCPVFGCALTNPSAR